MEIIGSAKQLFSSFGGWSFFYSITLILVIRILEFVILCKLILWDKQFAILLLLISGGVKSR